MVCDGSGLIFASLQVKELCPAMDVEELVDCSSGTLNRDVFEALRRIRTELEPEQVMGCIHSDISQEYIPAMDGLGAQGKASVAEPVMAVFDQDALIYAVLGLMICPGTFAALEHDTVIIDMNVAVSDDNVGADIQINGICAGRFHGLIGRIDATVEETDIPAAVEVISPEHGILQVKVRHGDMLTVGNIDQARALFILVGAGGVPRPPMPEGLPGTQPIAIYGTFSAHGEAVTAIRIDQGGKIEAAFTFDPRFHDRIVGYLITAKKDTVFLHIQMDTGAEKQSAGTKGAMGHIENAAAFAVNAINQCLNFSGMDESVRRDACICKGVAFSQGGKCGLVDIKEPIGYRRAIRKTRIGMHGSFLSLLKCQCRVQRQ